MECFWYGICCGNQKIREMLRVMEIQKFRSGTHLTCDRNMKFRRVIYVDE